MLLAALLLVFAARGIHTSLEKSFTIDEPHYVAKGLYLWRTGDYDWFYALRLHPPLAFHLASLPLLALDLGGLGAQRDAGLALVQGASSPPRQIRLASRLPFVLLGCLGAWLAFRWAREVAGDAAGVLAAFLYTFSPTLAAYASLVHSDLPIAVFYLLTLYTFWRWWRAPSALRLALCGVSLGLALAVKASAVLLPLILLAILGLCWLRPRDDAPAPGLRRSALALAAIGALALGVLWLSYGGSFQIQRAPLGPWPDVLAPDYLRSLLMDQTINTGEHYFWLFGANRTEAPFWTLPAAFLLKTPLPILLLAVAAAFRRAPAFREARLAPFLAIPAAVYLAFACFLIQLPYGLRYLLPLYPLLFVFIATRLGDVAGRGRRAALAVACGWLALVSVVTHPHYLSYFNALAGGPARAHALFADSNLDWGQDLPALAAWLAERGNPPLRAALYAVERPEAYGIRLEPLAGCEPVAGGLVAISVAVLRGVNTPDLFGRPPPGCYDWLLAHEPVARPGYSILVYDLGAG